MIKEILQEVENAIAEAYDYIAMNDYVSYVLYIGRADMIHGLKPQACTDCVIDYQADRYYDETREGFYLRYLNKNYKREGFNYAGTDGIDALSIEMMIYSHLWDSRYFLKSLVRMAAIVNGDGYLWKPVIPENGKWGFFKDTIIAPLKSKGLKLGDVVEKGCCTDLRNSFAHALYDVDADSRIITLRPKRGIQMMSFDEFQRKFLYSVILMNKMQNVLEMNHDAAGRKNTAITEAFYTPDGLKVQIYGKLQKRGDAVYPELRLVHIKDDANN